MKIAAIALAASAFALPAFAQDTPESHRKVFVFGGPMSAGHIYETLVPFAVPYEDAVVVGAGYQQFLGEPIEDVRVGLEVGAAVRAGPKTTGELWGGVVGRYDGFVTDSGIRVSPSLTFGVSVVNETMGVEAQRAAADGLPGEVLFYLSPEISISTVEDPDTEFFWRVHHRSGAWNSFGGGGSANATTIGFRKGF